MALNVQVLNQFLYNNYCNTEILDELGVTPAHFAAQGGHLDCILVWNTSSIATTILTTMNNNLLLFHCLWWHSTQLQLLLDRGYSILHADKDSQRPLDWADAMGQYICVRFLIMYEACWSFSREISQWVDRPTFIVECCLFTALLVIIMLLQGLA